MMIGGLCCGGVVGLTGLSLFFVRYSSHHTDKGNRFFDGHSNGGALYEQEKELENESFEKN